MKMITKKIVAILIILTTILINGTLAHTYRTETKRFNVPANSFYYNKIAFAVGKTVTVTAKADHGNVPIEVFGPKGRKVTDGTNKVSFTTGKRSGKYKVVFRNNTTKIQRVTAEYSVRVQPGRLLVITT